MTNIEARVAFPYRAQLGEGALWDVAQQRLYWVDIADNKVFAFDPESRSNLAYDVGESVGTVVLTQNDQLLLALRSGLAVMDPSSGTLTRLSDPQDGDPNTRFNDGKCDPSGRFWAGTMVERGPRGAGKLFCMDHELGITPKIDGVNISNGLVWTKDRREFFYIDTPTHQIKGFDYDDATASISAERVTATIPKEIGAPDGMTIDQDDQLWVALFGGHKVVRVNPHSGEIGYEVEVGAKNVTSCSFGGKQLDELYITTARVGTNPEELERWPNAGSLFCASLPFRGVPQPRFARDL